MHAIYHPPHLSFNDANNIWWIQIMKLLITW
jgi:hypothetical protein